MKLAYTILYVADVEKTVAFYEKAFGIKRGFVADAGQWAEMETGATKLSFANLEFARPAGIDLQQVVGPKSSYPFEVAFTTEQVQSAFDQAVASGCTAIMAPQQKPWGQLVSYVRDLNGFLVEICSPMSQE